MENCHMSVGEKSILVQGHATILSASNDPYLPKKLK